MRILVRDAARGLKQTFAEPRFALMGLGAAFLATVGAAWIANASLVGFIISSPIFLASDKALTTASILARTFTTLPWTLVAVIALNAALFGANMAITAFYVARRYRFGRAAGTSAIGAVIAVFGFGCASCGSVLLAFLLGSGAAAAILTRLPLKGLEFGIAGAAVMLASAAFAASRIPAAEACRIALKR